MMRKRILIAWFVMTFSPVAGVHPVGAQILSLDSILNIVARNNPELQAFDQQVRAYRTYAEGAKALHAPTVGAGLFMTPYDASMWKADPSMGTTGMGSFMISAEQMITNPGKLEARYAYMSSMAAADSTMKNAMRNELFAMTKMTYYEWIILARKAEVLESSEELMQYLVESAELRYTYGMDNMNAYYKAKAMLGDVQAMLIMNDQEIEMKRIMLNLLMNREKTLIFSIDTTLHILSYELLPVDTNSIASNRSDYQAVNRQIEVLHAKRDLELAERLPDFGIRYDHMVPFGTQPQQFSLMVMITVPVAPWSSDMYRANATGLTYEMDALEEQQENILNQASGTIEQLRTSIRSQKEQLALTKEVIIPALEKNYATELLAYEQNTGMLFMALDAWQNLKLARLLYLDQLMQLLVLQVQYEQEMEIR